MHLIRTVFQSQLGEPVTTEVRGDRVDLDLEPRGHDPGIHDE
jgi:hypothetical protein